MQLAGVRFVRGDTGDEYGALRERHVVSATGVRRRASLQWGLTRYGQLQHASKQAQHREYGEYGAYTEHVMKSDTIRAVRRLAYERPAWLPVLEAACTCARAARPYGGEFAGTWVIEELARQTGVRWLPGLRTLVAFGLLEKSGETVRGGRRAYYRMSDPDNVEHAVQAVRRHLGTRGE